jgi:hypothetical protein
MAEKPTTAFVLSLIGGIFILLGAIIIIAAASYVGFLGYGLGGSVLALFGVFGLVCGFLTILGAVWINSGEKDKVRNGGIIVLVFSILSWIGAGGGFFIGFILALVGAILALTWNPPTATSNTTPTPPAPP